MSGRGWMENEWFMSVGQEGFLVEVRSVDRASLWLEGRTGKPVTDLVVRPPHRVSTDRPNTTSVVLGRVKIVQVNKGGDRVKVEHVPGN